MADVANLIKLVDTRDIVELELKQKDYELIIRKKEALPPPPAPQHSTQGPHVMAHTMFPGYAQPPPAQPAAASAAPSTADAAAPAPVVPDAIPLAAEHPPMLSPMAGTFYKCPGPGEPPYVKVGDKVTKGQVVCIVEAMKLMNEIEADQSGTIVEILAEDGKPVSMESPLFVIKP
jgi:acetyl-CoA carboxylase biotin carboxyl carrier protein